MRCGARLGKVGGGGAMHMSLRWPHASREVRHLRRAEGACQARGRAAGAGIWTDAASEHSDASLSLIFTMTRVC
jgi:hypothetical protein